MKIQRFLKLGTQMYENYYYQLTHQLSVAWLFCTLQYSHHVHLQVFM